MTITKNSVPAVRCALTALLFFAAIGLRPLCASPEHPTVAEVAHQVVCQCPDCGKQTVDQCAPGCEYGKKYHTLIKQQIAKGKTESQILNFIADRDGEQLLAAPRAHGFGYAAYLLPALGVLVGLLPLTLALRRRDKNSGTVITNAIHEPAVGPAEEAVEDPRVAAALRDYDF